MSDDRPAFGIDMVPAVGMPMHEDDAPQPVTEAERHEHVNADVLRRVAHVSIQGLIERVRKLPLEGPYHVPNLVRLTAQELEAAIGRYLDTKRKFRQQR